MEAVTDPDLIAQLEKASPVEAVTDPDLIAALEDDVPRETSVARGVAEIASVAGTSALREPVAGLEGIAQTLNPMAPEGAGARTIEQGGTISGLPIMNPKLGPDGQAVAKAVGDTVQGGVNAAKGASARDLETGESSLLGGIGILVDRLQGVVDEFRRSPDAVAREFGPAAGAVAKTLPAALTALPALRGGKKAADVASSANPLLDVGKTGAAKRDLGRRIAEGEATRDTAKFTAKPTPGGAMVAVPDKAAKEAIRQGFDDGVVSAIKSATPRDKEKMRRMIQIKREAAKDARYQIVNRPSDVVGDTLLERAQVVRKANSEAGARLDDVANALKGQPVEFEPAVQSFVDDLGRMGIKIKDDLSVDFKGSDIEGLTGPENVVKNIVKRMRSGSRPDAYDVHRMKRFIDHNVTYGKAVEGIDGQIERVLKNLRHNLDGVLDSNFPEYNEVNSIYSETRGVIDELQSIAGKRFDFSGPNAEKQLGVLLRRVASNAQSRIPLLDAANGIEEVAKKYGGNMDDDLIVQIMFADELDRKFGNVARTSFQGQIEQPIRRGIEALQSPKKGAVEGIADLAVSGANRVRGVNDEKAFDALDRLLKP